MLSEKYMILLNKIISELCDYDNINELQIITILKKYGITSLWEQGKVIKYLKQKNIILKEKYLICSECLNIITKCSNLETSLDNEICPVCGTPAVKSESYIRTFYHINKKTTCA